MGRGYVARYVNRDEAGNGWMLEVEMPSSRWRPGACVWPIREGTQACGQSLHDLVLAEIRAYPCDLVGAKPPRRT